MTTTKFVDGQTIEYRAVQDDIGQYVSTRAKRRCVVIYFRNSKYQWICGAFSAMPAAEKRAAELIGSVIADRPR